MVEAIIKSSDLQTLTKLEKTSSDELIELKNAIEKKKEDVHQIINILNVLQKKQITIDLLRSSMLGKTLSGLVSHLDSNAQTEEWKKASTLAQNLLSSWKSLAKKEKKTDQAKPKQDSNSKKEEKKIADPFDYSKLDLTGDHYRDIMRKKFMEIL